MCLIDHFAFNSAINDSAVNDLVHWNIILLHLIDDFKCFLNLLFLSICFNKNTVGDSRRFDILGFH